MTSLVIRSAPSSPLDSQDPLVPIEGVPGHGVSIEETVAFFRDLCECTETPEADDCTFGCGARSAVRTQASSDRRVD